MHLQSASLFDIIKTLKGQQRPRPLACSIMRVRMASDCSIRLDAGLSLARFMTALRAPAKAGFNKTLLIVQAISSSVRLIKEGGGGLRSLTSLIFDNQTPS